MSIYQQYKPTEESVFLRLKDGDKVRVRIASEPAIFTSTFKDPNTGKETTSTKYAWLVWNRDDEQPRVLAQGKQVFNQIAELVDEWGEPTDFDVAISRTGALLDTKYSVVPVKVSKDLTDEQKEKVGKLDLPTLVKGYWLRDFVEDSSIMEKTDEMSEEELASMEQDIPEFK